MPNFFNTLLHKLLKDETYFVLLGNKAEVLELQGKEEAKKYWTEVKLFKSLFEVNRQEEATGTGLIWREV